MPYWVFLTAAVVLPAFLFLYMGQKKQHPLGSLLFAVGAAIACAALGAKLAYALMMCEREFPGYGIAALWRIAPEAFCFTAGAAVACGGIALAAKRTGIRAMSLLDLFTPAWLLAIALLRLGESALGTLGYGTLLEEGLPGPLGLLTASNEYGEVYLSVYVLEAIAALLCLISWTHHRRQEDGTAFRHAAFLLALAQILLENLRARGMKYGFVHAEQLLCAAALLALVFFACRRRDGGVRRFLPCLTLALCIGLIVGEEFLRQKSGIAFFSHYAYWLLALILAVMEGIWLWSEKKVQT